MTRLVDRVADARAQINRLHEGDWSIVSRVPEILAECVELEKTMLYQLDVTPAGVRLGMTVCDRRQMQDDVRRVFGGWLASGRPFAHFDARCPDPRQRNSVLTLQALHQLVPQRPEEEAIYGELWPSLGLSNYQQLRVLVCEGDSLLAWVGGFQEASPRQAQVRAMAALAPDLRRRLAWERWFGDVADQAAGFEQLIDGSLRPTFLLGQGARVIAENRAARSWLEEDRDSVLRLLDEVSSGKTRGDADVITVTARSFGRPLKLVLATRPARARVDPSAAAVNGDLPPRLRRVAVEVARGLTDKEVAARLGLSVATVRTYLRQLYTLMGVHNRVQLAAVVARR